MKNSIGIKNESSLHRTLKFQYVGKEGKTEAQIGEFVADGISSGGEVIEVQTGSFAPLVKKVKKFSKAGKVRIVHPVAVTKILEVYDEDGVLISKRKSPKKGSIWNIFDALVYTPILPFIKNVVIEVVLADIVEKRSKDGKGARRRKGISIKDKELSVWHEKVVFSKKTDFLRFVPFKKGEEFTAASLAERSGIKNNTAQKALYTLTKMNIVKRIRKNGKAYVYCR
ncbi:MAG: hypothetical protein FWC97_02200 [Treponema sp.]|nr:hypothetical protein [Treponema sp.]